MIKITKKQTQINPKYQKIYLKTIYILNKSINT